MQVAHSPGADIAIYCLRSALHVIMKKMQKRLVALAAIAVMGLLTFAGPASAQKKDKNAVERTISGIVSTEDDTPIPGAVVQLKNMKTLQVRSFIAREKGDYIFNSLSMDVDYELKAMANGKESPARTISTFDPHAKVTLNLKVK